MVKKHILIAAAVLGLCGAPLANAQKAAATLSRSDAGFVKDAAEGGMDEVKMGELAQQNASNQQVKAFGKKMIDDHSKLESELQSLAARKNVTLPTDISVTQKASNKLLSSKNGDSFDKSYVSSMLKDHKDDIQAFEKEANSGIDPDVKAFAQKALPTLQEHLKVAEQLAKQLGVEGQ